MAMTFWQEHDELRSRVRALEAKYETMRLATLEWGKDVESLQRWSDQHLLRIERLETDATCPHIVSSHGGTSYCDLALQTAAAQPASAAARQDKLDRLIAQDRDDGSTPFQVPPTNCSQRLQREGKPYPKSDCEACGTMSPMWRQCDVSLALEAVNSKPTPNPSQIRSSLVARVADAIYRNGTGDGFREEARAAIREVAAWLRVESEGHLGSGLHLSRRLEQEADR